MTSQSGGGGVQSTQTVAGVLSGNLLTPTFAAGSVPAELGYVQIVASQTGISATTMTDITGLTLTVTVGTRPIVIKVYTALLDGIAAVGNRASGQIVDVTGSAVVCGGLVLGANGNGGFLNMEIRVAPAAGVRTYKVQAQGDGTSVVRWFASATNPSYLRIFEA